ncbi:hypothetical protein HU200_006578 [Digitaria exilis]|uniref:PWWP domain-containing protein n=1 Tax=Digitaria exilis TaxID=1010633 RepID=A0A835FR21_9POAL|nr:hypothetical protein HU200_006578 [Digitaria exilis]
MVDKNVEKDYVIGESPSDKLRHNFQLGDITWVKPKGSPWWPAQVIDESCVGSKPKKKDKYDCLVRLYGTGQYMYVDPWKCNSEFELMLKQENKSAMEVFREVLEKVEQSSSIVYTEHATISDVSTKHISKNNSTRKVSKQEGLKQCNEEEDQDIRSSATRVTARKRKGGRVRQSSSTHDAIDKASSESSAEGLRNKRKKHAAQNASVGRREGLRRSGYTDAKQYLDAAGDSTELLTDINASEDATEDSMLNEISASHTEIKAMVRDILFKDIIEREHDAEMAYVDEVINGICDATEDNMSGGATASMKGGRGVKQSGSGVEGESSNVRQRGRDEATSSPASRKGNTDTTHANLMRFHQSRKAVVKTPGNLSARQVRQIRIMQSLGLIAPSGSPFGKNKEFIATNRRF